MLNGVVTRINGFISTLNAALELLPDWTTGEGGVRIGTLDPVALGGIDNPFAGAAETAGNAAADAFSAALRAPLSRPPIWTRGGGRECTCPGRWLPRGGRHVG